MGYEEDRRGSNAARLPSCPPLPSLPPLSLYLHFPWCVRKCPYCDFNSYALQGELPEAAYLDALRHDLEAALARNVDLSKREILSIFMGGGTPSLFSPAAVSALLESLRASLNLAEDAEITLEANPGTLCETLTAGKLADYQAAGINRLSLGIQSFNDDSLAALGRIHDAEGAKAAARMAVRHFSRVNLDMMYGLPGQTLNSAISDIETALAYGVTHLSCYQLGIEPHTAFAARPPDDLPEPDVCADMQEAIEARLLAVGFARYEISAFARPGFACRHNLNYWQFGDYLGLGAGAHSKITTANGIIRQTRFPQPDVYLREARQGSALQAETAVAAAEIPFEFLMNALRLTEGFSPDLFAARTRQPLSVIMPRLEEAEADGLIALSPERIAPTPEGCRFLNRLLMRFLP